MKFVKGFEKIAGRYFHNMHKSMNPKRALKGFSRKGLLALLRHRGIR